MTDTPAIAHQIYIALERLGADLELLSVIGSWGDTLNEEQVLQYLIEWNDSGKVLHERQ